MKKLYISMLFFMSPPLFAQYEQALIPQFAVGGGYQTNLLFTDLNGTDFPMDTWTAGVCVNPSSGINNNVWTDLLTIRVNGAPLEPQNNCFAISLKFHETKKYVITTTAKTMITGSLAINVYGYHDLSKVTISCFYNFYADGKLVTTTAVPISTTAATCTTFYVSNTSTSFRFPVEKNDRVNFGVAWMLQSFPYLTVTLHVTVNLYAPDGSLIKTKSGYAPFYASQFIDQIFEDIPRDFIGMVEVTSDYKLALMVLRMEANPDGSFLFTSIPLSR